MLDDPTIYLIAKIELPEPCTTIDGKLGGGGLGPSTWSVEACSRYAVFYILYVIYALCCTFFYYVFIYKCLNMRRYVCVYVTCWQYLLQTVSRGDEDPAYGHQPHRGTPNPEPPQCRRPKQD